MLFELPQEVRPLLGFLPNSVDVRGPKGGSKDPVVFEAYFKVYVLLSNSVHWLQ